MNVVIPDDVYREASRMAEDAHVSVGELLASVFSQHRAAWARIEERAKRGDRAKFLAVLDQVPRRPKRRKAAARRAS